MSILTISQPKTPLQDKLLFSAETGDPTCTHMSRAVNKGLIALSGISGFIGSMSYCTESLMISNFKNINVTGCPNYLEETHRVHSLGDRFLLCTVITNSVLVMKVSIDSCMYLKAKKCKDAGTYWIKEISKSALVLLGTTLLGFAISRGQGTDVCE